jgi:ATP-binding cassette subfamily B protein
MQLIQGMQDIKLNNAEIIRRWEWENIQAGLFNLHFKNLSLNQWQQSGAFFLNEGKNILITFFVAKAVIDGDLTLGEMLAIQYIIGQLASPIDQFIGFTQQLQDARISLERLNDIHGASDEEPTTKHFISSLPEDNSIDIDSLNFAYPGAGAQKVLTNINFNIPHGKTTAIVGMSGSGKTTLLKILLKFYDSYLGSIKVGDFDLSDISHSYWRSQCGTVMQDSFIFNDSIARNIAANVEVPNYERLCNAARIANILGFIESLPNGFNTKIGVEGNGISAGQKQRILIARAVYKNPKYILFDEATNSLDANNEKMIMENLSDFFKGKTVVVVAHRLSTVKNADNIIVLNNGHITEQGSHRVLIDLQGEYYHLIKNQLEL